MKKVKVIAVHKESLEFEEGIQLYSDHQQDCCEHHWLSFADLELADFNGLEFDLSTDDFFERIPDYGIELKPINGHSIKVPGYGSNNGYYGSNIDLVLSGKGFTRTYDVSDCQVIDY